MLPLQQAYEVRSAVLEFIKASYHFKDSEVGKAFYRFIEDDKNGLFKGPYISLKTPFKKAEESETIPLDIKPDFTPHKHQVESFKRLTTQGGHKPEPTLLTTGTGSGKTECFMYPILDYVYQINRNERQQGVKVIILYPMNALASDQAKRLAEAIYGTEENHPLRGVVTAGLFIGEGSDKQDYSTMMEEHRIIENRDTIVDTVPDILLTNFKMLDYGLMQQRYMPLWKGNIGESAPMLRFIVLDELHTYDGAQGTDVANLIRRLKLKLNLSADWLTPVGTSATIGNGNDSKELLCSYASDVFGVEFTQDSIIEEDRIDVDDFFDVDLSQEIPIDSQLKKLSMSGVNNTKEYVELARRTWLYGCTENPLEIGECIRKLQIVRDLLSITSKGILLLKDLIKELGRINPKFQRIINVHPDYAENIVESLLALISEAKLADDNGVPRFPLLYLQVQLWQRELSGIQRIVQSEPEFTWRDAIPVDDRIALPIYFCRDCGASGWLTTKKDTDQRFGNNSNVINEAFMNGDKEIRLMSMESSANEPLPEYCNDMSVNETYYLHQEDLTIGARTDPNILRVRTVSRGKQSKNGIKVKFDPKCPLCMNESLSIIGYRTSTLSSVAVSQIISSDFDTADVTKRKLLTFSNSVQDAAHLAGFYEVRTFRFLFRQSIQHYLKRIKRPITLAELQRGFKEYWKEQLPGEEYYYRFMPDELMEHINLKESYRDPNTGELTEKFKKEFDLRVDWEICSEFGFMSQRGRTLEKMGASATFFLEEDLRRVYEKMKPWFKENNFNFILEKEERFLRFVNGILHRLRGRGGIDHEFLKMFRTEQLKPVMLNWPRRRNIHFLYKKFGGNRIPHMMGYQPIGRGEEVLDVTTVRGNRPNWFYQYYVRSLVNPSGIIFQPNTDAVNDLYIKLMETLVECNIFDRQRTSVSNLDNFAIRPEAIYVEAAVQTNHCDKCESNIFVAKSDNLTEDMHCLEIKCNDGLYRIAPTPDNYYLKVYNREFAPRIYAHEHTGLLERGKREALEKDFKEHPSAQSCNVLTATSTLEMGIDIGDLNVVANTGIPPKPSNFLQRVGRAGRKEGSALVLNYAKSGKHDMFYFAEPLSMMEGKISTPGCFLEAKDILRRHFYAFCIDSWTSADRNNQIPGHIEYLHLGHDLLNDENFFINKINRFISDHRVLLTEKFKSQYPEYTLPVLDQLFSSLDDNTFFKRILNEFEQLIDRIQHIKEQQRELSARHDAIPANDKERRREILDQYRGLKSLLSSITKQSVVEFMTNAGLLPNYAFPETGIKLSATVYSRKALGDEGENTPDPETIELIRPATQGIRELAPDNLFYTQKLRLGIKGLNLADRTDSMKVMRFCSDCDALAPEGTLEFDLRNCPKCGSDSWASNRHKYLRFTTANTSVYRNDAALDDSNDDRDQKRYHTMKHYHFNHTGNVTSYGLKNVGFGIEFCKDLALTEVNYGNHDQKAETIEINRTKNISNLGFVTCRHCGKSTSVTYNDIEIKDLHFPFCNCKIVGFPADEEHKDTFEKLFLYRNMQTEAIKVLLPIQLFDTEASTQLFKAGLELGLRYYYKSSPDHIRIDAYKEYNKATQNFDNYLVIYDSIPGGTGYLTKLYDKNEFSKLLQISYEHIRDCECRLEGKDGCYHCILSYGNQWKRKDLSRERAEELFKRIVDECDNWEEIEGSVGTITTSGVIEDSELEILFVKSMERIARDNHWKWERKNDPINETYNYILVIKDEEKGTEIKYNIYPQYRLGPSKGVKKTTIPDFQFICAYAIYKGREIELTNIPEWSVYLDGYAYHASAENPGFDKDFQRREAIRLCPNPLRLSWTLTWNDIKPYIKPEEYSNFSDKLYKASPEIEFLQIFNNELWRKKDSLSRFIYFLSHPEIEELRKEAFNYIACCWTNDQQYMATYDTIDEAVRENARDQYNHEVGEEDLENEHFFVKTTFIGRNSLLNGNAWYPYDAYDNFAHSLRYKWGLEDSHGEINRDDWEDFWRRYNIIQFFHYEPNMIPNEHPDINEILPLYPGLENIIRTLYDHNVYFDTENSFCIIDDEGGILAEAAIKIDNRNVVIDDFDEETKEIFQSRGYKVLTPNTFSIEQILNVE